VRSADQILLLERGRVVERGTHNELMTRRGAYATLAAEQSSPASDRRPGADLALARGRWTEPHGHRGLRASI
jgi:ABC-type glutathione transport system ATPase component